MTPAPEQSLASWWTKNETAALLGVSPKSVERYVSEGKLNQKSRAQRGTPAVAVYDPAEVEALRDKLAKPAAVLPAVRPEAVQTVALAPQFSEVLERVSDSLVTQLRHIAEARAPLPSYVSLAQAVSLTGLSGQTIRDLAVPPNGTIKTMPFGRGVRYRRADLEAL